MARILLVEDDTCLGMVLVDLLQSAHHEVCHADNAVAGLNAFREQPADLVITDMLTPEMDGVETIRRLRQYDPKLRIIATSDDGRAFARLYLCIAKQLGVNRTLAKPFTGEEFLNAVREVLEMP